MIIHELDKCSMKTVSTKILKNVVIYSSIVRYFIQLTFSSNDNSWISEYLCPKLLKKVIFF